MAKVRVHCPQADHLANVVCGGSFNDESEWSCVVPFKFALFLRFDRRVRSGSYNFTTTGEA